MEIFFLKIISIHILKCWVSDESVTPATVFSSEMWPELWASEMVKLDLIQGSVMCLKTWFLDEKYILNVF